MPHEAEQYPPIYTVAERLMQLRFRAASTLAQLSFQSIVRSGAHILMIGHRNLPGYQSPSNLSPEPADPSPEDVSRFLRGIDRHLATAALRHNPCMQAACAVVSKQAELLGVEWD